MSETLNKVYGIDLGTTYSAIAYVDETGKPVVVPNAENERITPSVVFFDGDNVVVGTVAKESSKLYPEEVAEMVKRDMGNPNYLFKRNGESYKPEEISAYVLRKLVQDAEQSTGEKITDVVITCPAYFGINQREATAKAGEIAGLNVRSIISEPTAAAIAYGMENQEDQVVLVYDLGGGTFDITMIEVKEGDITVVGTGGNHNLGGKDWDMAIVNYLVEQYQEEVGEDEDILEDAETLQDLYISAERAKRILSQRARAPMAVTHAGNRVKVELARERFDELTTPLLEQTVTLTKDMLEEARKKGYDRFDRILLVGGSTRMPQVARRLQEEFTITCESFDPDEAVAKGAALFGKKLAVDDKVNEWVKKKWAEITGEDAGDVKVEDIVQENPDIVQDAIEGVAGTYGLPMPEVKGDYEQKIVNVTSKTFGIKVCTKFDPDPERQEFKVANQVFRNDPVPADVTKTYGTLCENQEEIEVVLYENLSLEELADVEDCTELQKADMKLPPGLPENAPIKVNFKLNGQGRLEVTATDPEGSKVSLNVENVGVMSDEEVAAAKSRALGKPMD